MRWLLECVSLVVLTVLGSLLSLLMGWSPEPWSAGSWASDGFISLSAIDAEVFWVDARSQKDYEAGSMDGAIHLGGDNWDDGIVNLLSAWLNDPRMIVVYCGGADCGLSKRMVERLGSALEGAEVYALEGGWEALNR